MYEVMLYNHGIDDWLCKRKEDPYNHVATELAKTRLQ